MEQEPKTYPKSFSPPVGKLASEDGTVAICNDNGEEGNKDKEKADDNNDEAVVESKNDKLTEEEPRMFLLSNNGTLCLEFLEDQGREDNFTDLDLICCDGYIQVHRCLLMGASKFLRDLLIEKDIMDTTAITLPDITVRHLRQALGLLYTGKTLIDECDEVEVFETMNVLGLPVSGLLCRTAKLNDMNQIALLRHNLADDGIFVKEVGEDEDMEKSMDRENSEENEMVTNEKQQKTTEVLDTGGDDTQENVELAKEPTLTNDGVNDEDILQQITSTTGDTDSPNDFVPPSQDGNFKSEDFLEGVNKGSNSNQYKLKTNGDVQTDSDHGPMILKSDDGSEENMTITNVADDEEIEKNQESQLNDSSHSIPSDQEDLSFEAACNDLQKQVAKPIPTIDTTLTATSATGHEMKLRKRKTNEPADESKLSTDEKLGARSDGVKKKKATPKSRKNRNTTNGTNSDVEDKSNTTDKREVDNTAAENSKDKFSNRVYGTKSEKSDSTSQKQQHRLSTCSSTTDSNGTAAAPFSRVFLEVKEFNGIKYNIYGLMDSEKGIQSGKTVAIMTSKDKSTATNVKI